MPFCLSRVPTCLTGSLDTDLCQCNRESDSTCPSGLVPVGKSPHICSCESRTQPLCKTILNPATCRCEVFPPPPCIPGNVQCSIPTTAPYCPTGFVLHGCECIKKAERECSSGELSSDRCTCSESFGPLCVGSGCELNTEDCSCGGKPGTVLNTIDVPIILTQNLRLDYCASPRGAALGLVFLSLILQSAAIEEC